jgi:hypothetical protein
MSDPERTARAIMRAAIRIATAIAVATLARLK